MTVQVKGRFMMVCCHFLAVLGAVLASSCGTPDYGRTWTPPPRPPAQVYERREPVPYGLAQDLYDLARRENRKLHWDDCLARMAHHRAREIAASGRLDHKDPRTGKNPAWNLIGSCVQYRCAGENLVRGDDTAHALHRALMDSLTHRENLLNPEFDLLGIGCYRNVCVQLFAGY